PARCGGEGGGGQGGKSSQEVMSPSPLSPEAGGEGSKVAPLPRSGGKGRLREQPRNALPNRLRRLLARRNFGRVFAVLHPLVEVGLGLFQNRGVLQQIDRGQGQHL